MSDLGKLCYKKAGGAGAGKLCFKKSSGGTSGGDAGKLVYAALGGPVSISMAWDVGGRDLDLCGFWEGASDLQVGYGYLYKLREQGVYTKGAYKITYSGDYRGTDDTEWMVIEKTEWDGTPEDFYLYLNFFEYDAELYPEDKCVLVVSQAGGSSQVLQDLLCGTGRHEKATPGRHPGIRISFDGRGHVVSVTPVAAVSEGT